MKTLFLTLFLQLIKETIRSVLELVGITRYSKPGKYQLDTVLQAYLPKTGVFLEVGALNGFSESNTYYLEKFHGWSGTLVEPVPHFFSECVKRRKKSKVFNCALVANDYSQSTVNMVFAERMSTVKGAMSAELESIHLEKASKGGAECYEFEAAARTLTSVLKEAGTAEIDFFSLDVEGFEIQVLNGLDMNLFRPHWILVECLTPQAREEMSDYMTHKNYEFIAQVTPRDLLWRASGNVQS